MRAYGTRTIWVGVAAGILLIAAAGCSGIPQAGLPVNTPAPAATVILDASTTVPATAAPVQTAQPSVSATATVSTTAVAPAMTAVTPTLAADAPRATMERTPPATPAAAGQSSAQAGIQYRDDFTALDSGWPNNVQFGNYYIGYHEPDHYHVDIHAPHDRAIVPIPKHTFTDFTIEARVMAEPNNTAPTGDFRFGLVFRRAGNQFYAFTISPHTKDWQVLKSAPNGVTVLTQGANAPTQGLTADDVLRIDARGSNFFFTLNGQLLGAVSDAAYATGEAGFYVETIDSTRVHAHWGTLIVRDVELPESVCTVLTTALNVRKGPDVKAYPVIGGARRGAQLEPLGRDAAGTWLKVRVVGSNTTGWIFAFPAFVSCNLTINDLAVVNP